MMDRIGGYGRGIGGGRNDQRYHGHAGVKRKGHYDNNSDAPAQRQRMGNEVPMASSLSQPSAVALAQQLPEPMELSELPPVPIVSIQGIKFDRDWKKELSDDVKYSLLSLFSNAASVETQKKYLKTFVDRSNQDSIKGKKRNDGYNPQHHISTILKPAMENLVTERGVGLEALSKCGAATVIELKNSWDKLVEKGLDKNAILKISICKGAHLAITTLLEKWDDLIDLELEPKDIVSIASHDGANQAITTLLNKWDDLRALELEPKDIVSIASNIGATQAITTLLAKWDDLIAKELEPKDIVSIASHDGSNQAITTLLKKWDDLISQGYTKSRIVSAFSSQYGVLGLLE